MMNRKKLKEKLGELGFPLFEAEDAIDANSVLAELINSNDARLLEGFPVVFAAINDRGLMNQRRLFTILNNKRQKSNFYSLLEVSLALYDFNNLSFSWANNYFKSLTANQKKEIKYFLAAIKADSNLQVAGQILSAQRFKNTFKNYFVHVKSSLGDLLTRKEEFDLEFSLSQIFSPKQKELFVKKFKGEKLTKTEKEYFSRAVKKKVMALANSQLHRLSQKVLE